MVGCEGPVQDPDPATDGTTGSSETTASTVTGAESLDGSSSGAAGGCPAAGPMGGEPGQIVPSLLATQCDGTSITLDELYCGHPVTLVDIGGAGFDICVESTIEYATSPEYDDLQARGLQIVQIFALDDTNSVPTTDFCEEYSQMHSVDFEFLIDQIGATHTIAPMYPFIMVLDAEGRVLHQWDYPLPEDRVEILDGLLDAAG